ncbi:unnamed protein product [Thlaspi arvense]|uniref:Uncharacterized protein n=1 Tax=Thlaspi arvense TaxID=13288 RepID=A0AAU9RU92_THLAR|nr:unnamed protein product [Thlaspi arvense]
MHEFGSTRHEFFVVHDANDLEDQMVGADIGMERACLMGTGDGFKLPINTHVLGILLHFWAEPTFKTIDEAT